MRFPSKVTPYKDSILAKFTVVLSVLEVTDMHPADLYKKVRSKVNDVGEFLEILDCLFALGTIEFNDERDVLRYVDRSHV